MTASAIVGAVITADALHAQRSHAEYLAGRGAHYLLVVKRTQPGLHARLTALPWREVPVACDIRERGHGRTEQRTLKITSVARGLPFPHAAQAIQIVRRRTVKGKRSTKTCYVVTSLGVTQASPAQLAGIIRGHWGIEDLRDFKTRLPPLTCGFVTSSAGLYAAFLYLLISPPGTRCRRRFPSLGPVTEAGSISSGRGGRRSRARCGRCWL